MGGAVPEGIAVFLEEAVAEDPLEEWDEVDWGEAEARSGPCEEGSFEGGGEGESGAIAGEDAEAEGGFAGGGADGGEEGRFRENEEGRAEDEEGRGGLEEEPGVG